MENTFWTALATSALAALVTENRKFSLVALAGGVLVAVIIVASKA